VVRAPVRVGAVEGDQAQILNGLSAGDRVVTVGPGWSQARHERSSRSL
jgi:hypothetical protein